MGAYVGVQEINIRALNKLLRNKLKFTNIKHWN